MVKKVYLQQPLLNQANQSMLNWPLPQKYTNIISLHKWLQNNHEDYTSSKKKKLLKLYATKDLQPTRIAEGKKDNISNKNRSSSNCMQQKTSNQAEQQYKTYHSLQ